MIKRATTPTAQKSEHKGYCDWSNDFGMIIHRFDMGKDVCICGKEKVERNEDEKRKLNVGLKANFKKIFNSTEDKKVALSANSSAIRLMTGIVARHGRHHEAQKSRMTTSLPA